MSGVDVIGEILRASAAVTALVPAARVKEDLLSQKTVLPAIAVGSISVVDLNTFSNGETRRVTERIQVTVAAADVRTRKALMLAVRNAASKAVGSYADVTDVSVLLDGAGPSLPLTDPTMFLKTQDFRVSYNEPTA